MFNTLVGGGQMRTACSFRMCSLRNACEVWKRKHNGHLNCNKLARLQNGTFGIGDTVSWAWDTDGIDCGICTVDLCFGNFAANSWVFCINIAHRIWSWILHWFVCAGAIGTVWLLDLENESRELAWDGSNSTAVPMWKERKVKMLIKRSKRNDLTEERFTNFSILLQNSLLLDFTKVGVHGKEKVIIRGKPSPTILAD